jgi:DNA polymerase epsilon subunit 2
MPVSRQQIIIRVFRKYSHSLGPEELEYLDQILKEHDIPEEDVEMSIELIAKEYNRQDGLSVDVSSQGSGLTPTFAKMLP